MKHFNNSTLAMVFVAALMLGGICATPAYAQDATPSQYKIGVINMAEVVRDYEKRQNLYDELQTEVDSLQVEIDRLSTEIETKRGRLEEEGRSMEAEAARALRAEIDQLVIDYEAELRRRQRVVDEKEAEILREVMADIEQVVSAVAEGENYHLILNTSGTARGSVIWSAPSIDLTSTITSRLNGQK